MNSFFEDDRHHEDEDEGDDDLRQQEQQQQQQTSRPQSSSTLYKTGGCGSSRRRRVALLQTLALVSMALMLQQKLSTAAAVDAAAASSYAVHHAQQQQLHVVMEKKDDDDADAAAAAAAGVGVAIQTEIQLDTTTTTTTTSKNIWSMLDNDDNSATIDDGSGDHEEDQDDDNDENLVVMEDCRTPNDADTCEYTESSNGNNSNKSNDDVEPEDVLIVSTVDGSLTGISRSTGEVLWQQPGRGVARMKSAGSSTQQPPSEGKPKQDNDDDDNMPFRRWNTKSSHFSSRIPKHTESEAPSFSLLEPLVSTTTTIHSSTSDWRTTAVPSMDGSTVYLTAAAAAASAMDDNDDEEGGGGGGDVTVTASLRELVNRAPFVDSRGRIYTGSRKSVAVAIDGNTGQVLQVVSADQPFFSSSSSSSSASSNKKKEKHGSSSSSSRFLQHDADSGSIDNDDDDRGEQCHSRWQGHRNVVWIGRIDHSISIHEPRSGNVDVQFSGAQIMSVNDMVLGQAHSQPPWSSTSSSTSSSNPFFSIQQQQQHRHRHLLPADPFFEQEQRQQQRASSSILVATPNGNLALRNPQTGQMIWVSNERFASPVAFAVDAATGESLSVDLIPDAAAPNGSLEYLSREMQRQFDIMTKIDVDNNIVDTNDDDSTSSSSSSMSHDIVGSLPNGQLFAMPLGRKGGSANGRSARSSLSQHHYHHQQPAITATTVSANAQNKPRPLVSRIAQLLQRQTPKQQQQHHPIVIPAKKACMPGMPNFPSCLVMSKNDPDTSSLANQQYHHGQHQQQHHGSFLSDASFTASHRRFLNQPYLPQSNQQYHIGQMGGQQDNAMVPFHDADQYGYHYPPYHHPFYSTLTTNQDRNRKKYQKLLKILGSWLPPTIALIFVVSFELGRRKRQNDASSNAADVNAITNGGGSGPESFSDGTSNDGSTSAMKDGGAIQVLDNEILGYGGHGTVVYKGLLDGRQVAVKRMLKAYHASADREISLLIESDGHPNVVRYFLKEVRGDFVYLALELCDLSLHDLIGNLKSTYDQMEKENQLPSSNNNIVSAHNHTVSPSIKAILLQIANGVKHLHGLRIVHRDLKPANILLADARKSKRKNKDSTVESVFAIFQHGDYVAKISDMGLGKQIIGQSSYGGASTMLESSSMMHGGGVQQSSIAGAGPGSVGWQAPEVMAMRTILTDNISVRSNEGSATTGAFGASATPEASPLDVTGSARTSRSIDIFSLGCIFYSTLVPASHPFGEWYEREANIMHNRPNMKALEDLSPDAHDLVASMLHRTPSCRPTAKLICDHPFFWSPDRRLMFLCDFSDRLESEVVDNDGNMSSACIALQLRVERSAARVVGTSWTVNLDESLVSNVQRFRTYDPSSIRDLLRLIRNKHHHYDELPLELRTAMGSNTEGLMNYFDARFPLLLIHCFNVCREMVPPDDAFATKYSIARTPNFGRSLDRRVTSIIETTIKPAFVPADSPPLTDKGLREPVMDNDHTTSDKEEACTAEDDGSLVVQANVPPIAPDELYGSDIGSEEILDAVTEDECMPHTAGDKDEEEAPPCLSQESTEDNTDTVAAAVDAGDMVIWEGSSAAKMFNNRGWSRSDDEWIRRTDAAIRRPTNNSNNSILARCATDPKFRTRLCNHWDASQGTFCPMRKKNKCVFAHGPAELRVKENKRNRWGKLVDKNGDTKNPRHSGGEDTYGAARMIETERKGEGKWNVGSNKNQQQSNKVGKKPPNASKKKDSTKEAPE
jgi:serine/threonine protein kinase